VSGIVWESYGVGLGSWFLIRRGLQCFLVSVGGGGGVGVGVGGDVDSKKLRGKDGGGVVGRGCVRVGSGTSVSLTAGAEFVAGSGWCSCV